MKTKVYCVGCHDNIYNTNERECWSLSKAKLTKLKEVHVEDRPPWKHQRIIKVPNCYHRPKYVYVDPKQNY